jgi:hypothetical protein
LFLSVTCIAGVLIGFRTHGLDIYLTPILYFDYRGYDQKKVRAIEYFRQEIELSVKPQIDINTLPVDSNTSRKLNKDDVKTEDNDMGVLQLNENKEVIIFPEDFLQKNNPTTVFTKDASICKNLTHKYISLADYQALGFINSCKYDKRTHFQFFKDRLILKHTVISLIFKRSLKDPLAIRLQKLIFSISMQFAINAMMYSDSYIDSRLNNSSSVHKYLT